VKISRLGEFGLIDYLTDIINKSKDATTPSWQRLIVGIGDDAAAWQCPGSIQLATTDSLVQDVHFDLSFTSWEDLGWKAMAANLSDIAAMGGSPGYALISLALPGELDTDCISRLYHGMADIANRFGVAIVGGNIAASDKVNITIAIFGSLKDKSMLLRSAAIPGDQIAVTGYLGLSAAGLRMLQQSLRFDAEAAELFSLAYRRPMPKVEVGQALLHCGVRAAIDISDGLIGDLNHICRASKVGAKINENLLPAHLALKANFKSDWQQFVLSGGEDYELLFTATNKVIARIKKTVSCPITVIGEITEQPLGRVTLLDAAGKINPWRQAGWEHFKSRLRA
jgi:thiamine-monophosphate kinase